MIEFGEKRCSTKGSSTQATGPRGASRSISSQSIIARKLSSKPPMATSSSRRATKVWVETMLVRIRLGRMSPSTCVMSGRGT